MQRKYPMECNPLTDEAREDEKKKKKKKTWPQMKCEAKYTMLCAQRWKTLAGEVFFFTGPSRSVARVGGVHCVCVCVCVRACVCVWRGSWVQVLPYWANSANNSSLTRWLHSVPDPTAEKYASRSTLSEPAFFASSKTMEWAPQLEAAARIWYYIRRASVASQIRETIITSATFPYKTS